MYRFLTVVLLLSFINSKSQSSQIGVGIVDLNTIFSNMTAKDTSSSGKTRSTINFKPVLTYNYVNKNNIDYGVQAGYFHERYYNANRGLFTDKSIGINSNRTTKNSIYLKLGIAKRIDYEKFYISFGIQVPLSVTIYNYNRVYSVVNDSTGKFIQSTTNTSSYPNSYYAGLLLNVSSFYKLYKNLYVGGELQYGLYYTLQYGNRTYSSNEISNNGVDYSKVQVSKWNNQQFQLVVIPTIHLRYTIFNKNEETKPSNK